MIVCQYALDPYSLTNKILLYFVIVAGTLKAFFFLRVFNMMAYTIIILMYVIKKLQAFLIFYFLIIFMMSMLVSITGLQN